MKRRGPLLVIGAGMVAAAAGLGLALRRAPTTDSPAATQGSALWPLRFDRPEGGDLVFAALRGRAVVLNFWATWCPPCVKELPEFEKLHQAHHRQGVQVVGLAVDNAVPVRQFLARQPVSFAVGLAGFEGIELSRQLGNSGGALPFTVVFDSRGVLRHRKLGPTEFEELSHWVKTL